MLRATAFALVAVLLSTPALWTDNAKDAPKKEGAKKKPQKDQPPAGRAELLRPIPKKFGELKSKHEATRQVVVHFDGDKEPTTWTVNPDAELKQLTWWVRLRDIRDETRVWVWLDIDRQRKPKSVLMMCDEITQQELNNLPYRLTAADVEAQTVTLKPAKGDARTLKFNSGFRLAKADGKLQFQSSRKGGYQVEADDLKVGEPVYVNTIRGEVHYLLNAAGLDKIRGDMKANLRNHWVHHGLPGTVSILHPLSGEMEVLLDHEAIRWGRALKLGDKVKLNVAQPIEAVVKETRPWRERTVVRLVMDGFAQHDLTLGQRIGLLVPTPPPEVDADEYPPDIDRPRSRAERIEWFLASTYCSCLVGGNGCTGMFYTLASCNVNACGMPNLVRGKVGDYIDKGMTDKQIWDKLKAEGHAAMLRPHLMP